MRRMLFFILMILFCFSTQGFAQPVTLISDNFDSYTSGLIPPPPWNVNEYYNGTVRVNNSVSFSSSNSVAVTASGGNASDTPLFGQLHTSIVGRGEYEAYLRTNNVDNETLVMSSGGNGSGNDLGFWISLGGPANFGIPSGHLAYWDGSSWHDIMAISNNTWYHVKVAVDILSKTFDIYVDNMATPVITGASFQDTTLTDLNGIVFVVFGSASNPNPSSPGVDYAYVDNVLVTDTTEDVPTMTEWGMIIFTVLAGLGAVYYIRRQKRAAS